MEHLSAPDNQLWANAGIKGLGVIALLLLLLVTAIFPVIGVIFIVALLGVTIFLLFPKWPVWLLYALVIFTPLETLILRYAPVPDNVFLLLQFSGEMLVYVGFIGLLINKLLTRQSIAVTPLDIPILIFIAVMLISIFVNQTDLLASFSNLRPLLRYVILYYFVVQLKLTQKTVRRVLHLILLLGILQLLIGGLQIASRGAINEFLLPRVTELQLLGQSRQFILISRGREIGSIFGTLGDTLFFSFFMLTVLAVFLGRYGGINVQTAVFVLLCLTAVNYSFVRSSVFGLFLLLLLFYLWRYRLNRMLGLMLLFLPLGIIGAIFIMNLINSGDTFVNPRFQQQNIIQNITGVFSRDYFRIAQRQRLGALLNTTPTILANEPWLGYGPDTTTTIALINESEPSFLLRPVREQGFEDVYWVALLSYFGILGISSLAFILLRLYFIAHRIFKETAVPITKQLALAVGITTGTAPLLLLFNQTLEIRIYSFFFWLLPGMMMALYIQERKGRLQPTSKKHTPRPQS